MSSDYLRRKETKPAENNQPKSFTFSSLLLYMEEGRVQW